MNFLKLAFVPKYFFGIVLGLGLIAGAIIEIICAIHPFMNTVCLLYLMIVTTINQLIISFYFIS
jgi:hypothetical protein